MKKSVLLGFFVLMVLVVGMSGVFAVGGDTSDTAAGAAANPPVGDVPAPVAPPAPAQPTISWTKEGIFSRDIQTNLEKWTIGAFEEKEAINIIFIKWLFLLFVILLAYSALSFVNFPEGTILQFVLAIIVSFIGMMFIKADAIAAASISYGAMSVALILIIPLLVLGFFTFVMAVKGKVVGILLQRVMWAIYSVWLFFHSGYALLVGSKSGFATSVRSVFEFLNIDMLNPAGNRLVMLVMFVSSIILFFSVVLFNKWFTTHLMADARETAVEKYKDIAAKAKAVEDIRAKTVEEAGK